MASDEKREITENKIWAGNRVGSNMRITCQRTGIGLAHLVQEFSPTSIPCGKCIPKHVHNKTKISQKWARLKEYGKTALLCAQLNTNIGGPGKGKKVAKQGGSGR